VDTHIEVVLLGDSSIFDLSYVQALQSRLEALSTVSSAASPLRHVHEKLLYHAVIGTTIQKTVGALLQRAEGEGTLDPAAMAKILGDYHARASTGTTLFVLHRQLTAGSSYRYRNAGPACWKRTFIAQDASFAWLDISAAADEIQPVTADFPVLTTPMQDLQFFTKDQGRTIDSLAALIHRSGEGFNQFPAHSSSSSPSRAAARQEQQQQLDAMPFYNNNVEILGITICVEDEAKGHSLCENDLTASLVAQELSRMYSDANLAISYNAVKFGLNDEACFAHAFFSSIHHSSTSTVTIIDSNEMLYWLSSALKVQELVASYSKPRVTVVPVFILKMPPSVATFFDVPDQRSVVTTFPVPAGAAKGVSWPANVVLYARSVDQPRDALRNEGTREAETERSEEAANSANIAIRRFPVLHCGDSVLPTGAANEVVKDELRDGMKEAIWGIVAGNTHYSGSTRGPVQDYLWYTPVPLRLTELEIPINSGESFVDRRTVPRLRFINRAEDILRQFVGIMRQAAATHPPVNSTLLFEIGVGENTLSTGAAAAAAAGFSKKSPSTAKKLSAIKKSNKSPGLLSEFLTYMDTASNDFSHLDFVVALNTLNGAEKVLDRLRKRMLFILNTRSGSLTCKTPERQEKEEMQAMLQKMQEMHDTMHPPSSGSSEEEIAAAKELHRDSAARKEASESFFEKLKLVMQVLLGAGMSVIGAMAGIYARKIQEKYRKHYL